MQQTYEHLCFYFIVFYSLKRCINKHENTNSHMGSTQHEWLTKNLILTPHNASESLVKLNDILVPLTLLRLVAMLCRQCHRYHILNSDFSACVPFYGYCNDYCKLHLVAHNIMRFSSSKVVATHMLSVD